MLFFYLWSRVLSQIEQKLTQMLTPAAESLGFEMVGVELITLKVSVLKIAQMYHSKPAQYWM